jgi:hypothetical protein
MTAPITLATNAAGPTSSPGQAVHLSNRQAGLGAPAARPVQRVDRDGALAVTLAQSARSTQVRSLQVLYRGPLESCNYGCSYCPFAKRREQAAAVRVDREALTRFVDWACDVANLGARAAALEVLFTPWGEALHRARYQKAIRRLLSEPHIPFVGVQTNLSAAPKWIETIRVDQRSKLTLWASWHPTETSLVSFVSRVQKTQALGATVSAGAVGLRENLALIDRLNEALHKVGSRVQWINAYKRGYRTPRDYYTDEQVERLTRIDPWFGQDLLGERSIGRPCATGTDVVSIDGNGDVTRCHFTSRRLGNIYADPIDNIVSPPDDYRPCPRGECNCFQGYVHLLDTKLHAAFSGSDALGRTQTQVSNNGL